MRLPCLVILLFCVLPFSVNAQSLTEADKKSISIDALAVLDQFMLHFNALNVSQWEATFHFPHYRLASGSMNILNDPSGRTAQQLQQALGKEWHHSAWLKREVLHVSENKVHINTRFARYREDNSVIAEYDSLYLVTRENGRWGIKLRSSMAP